MYKFNDVMVKENQNKIQLVGEEFPKCMKKTVKATDKALCKLVCQINSNEIEIDGDIERLSNIAVSKLIGLIDEYKGYEISIRIVKSGTMKKDDTVTRVIDLLHRGVQQEHAEFFVTNAS